MRPRYPLRSFQGRFDVDRGETTGRKGSDPFRLEQDQQYRRGPTWNSVARRKAVGRNHEPSLTRPLGSKQFAAGTACCLDRPPTGKRYRGEVVKDARADKVAILEASPPFRQYADERSGKRVAERPLAEGPYSCFTDPRGAPHLTETYSERLTRRQRQRCSIKRSWLFSARSFTIISRLR